MIDSQSFLEWTEVLFDERTKGRCAPKFRRAKKNRNKDTSACMSDGSTSSASATTSLSMSESCESLPDANAALPSLPAWPKFPVDPVAHKPTSLDDLAATYDSLPLSPLSFMSEDLDDYVYLPDYGLGDAGVKWPDPNEVPKSPKSPCNFSHLLPTVAVDSSQGPPDDLASPGSFCPTTLADEEEGFNEMMDELDQFMDTAVKKHVEWVSYADTLVRMDDGSESADEVSFVSVFLDLFLAWLNELLYTWHFLFFSNPACGQPCVQDLMKAEGMAQAFEGYQQDATLPMDITAVEA